MTKTITETGYAAFDRSHPEKGLKNFWVGGAQTGANVQVLTTNLEEITLEESDDYIKVYCCWYNCNHKRQVDFEIIKIERIKTITINQIK